MEGRERGGGSGTLSSLPLPQGQKMRREARGVTVGKNEARIE